MSTSLASILVIAMAISYPALTSPRFLEQADHSRVTNSDIPRADCADTETRKSCNSFNEMLRAKDSDLAVLTNRQFVNYVCFQKELDLFTVVSFSSPPKEAADEHHLGLLFFKQYADGQADLSDTVSVTWSQDWDSEPSAAILQHNPFDRIKEAFIDDRQISITMWFKSVADKDSQMRLTIRKSTGRFVEDISYKTSPNKKDYDGNLSASGRCISY